MCCDTCGFFFFSQYENAVPACMSYEQETIKRIMFETRLFLRGSWAGFPIWESSGFLIENLLPGGLAKGKLTLGLNK